MAAHPSPEVDVCCRGLGRWLMSSDGSATARFRGLSGLWKDRLRLADVVC